MFNFFIIMDENLGNTIARHFSSKYLNYTINFIISKEFPSFSDFPDFSLVLCDLDQNIELAKKYNKKLDIHTRILPDDMNLIKKFRKIALSIESNDSHAIENLKARLPEIEKTTKVRVINVLNDRMTKEDCLQYINKMRIIGVKQITFRQMFGNKKAYQNFLKIKDSIDISGVMFLPDGEYHHYYFTTNNKLYPYFFGYTENDRKMWMKKYEEIEQYCG